MTRRSWLASALALAATGAVAPFALSGCGVARSVDGAGHADGTTRTTDPRGFELVGSTRTRSAPDPKELGAAVDAVQDFGAAAFGALAARGSGNLVLSPASIHLALAMALLGARGTTAGEMLTTLRAADAKTLARGLNALTATLMSRAGKVELDPDHNATIQFDIADALWGQKDVAWAPEFLDALAGDFGAGMRVVDFSTRSEPTRRTINRWVSDVTHQTIPELIGTGMLDPSTRLTLVNALYLKAPWAVPFLEEQTAEGTFLRADGRRVRAPFMHLNESLAYAAAPGWEAVRLEYVGGRLAMTLVLPAPGREADLLAGLGGTKLRTILAAPRPAGVELALPKWRTRTEVELSELLKRLGMHSAFGGEADFSGMTTTKEGLFISSVVHQGYISVDEAGTEASAATAVMMAASAVSRTQKVSFDRPFLYILHDGETKTPLFIGRIDDPTAG